VDQPPLVPLIARLSELVAGTSPFAIRVLPALAVGAIALLVASMARRLGGGALAQTFAAFATAWSGVVLGEGHLLSTAIFDFLFWTVALWIMVGILDGADPRWWIVLGLTVGIGMQNKHTIALLAAGILIALLASGRRRLLTSVWPWIGVALAVVLAAPNLLWQATNGWPQLEMAAALRRRSDGPVAFLVLQPALLSISLAVPAALGLWRLLRNPEQARWKPLGVTYLLLFVVVLVTAGKAYYIAPMYGLLLASGAVWFESLAHRPRRVVATASAVGVAIGLFISLPLLPIRSASTLDATGELGETVGWEELVTQVAGIRAGIPSDEEIAIFTGTYGEAGAIDILGRSAGLPNATSGHNSYWLWGPPGPHGAIIGVGQVGHVLELVCPYVQQVAEISNPYGVANEEAGLPILVCRDPARQLADVWDEVRHYD